MFLKRVFCFAIPGIFALASCTKDVERNLEAGEKPLYITKPASSIDFSSYATLALQIR